MTTPATPKLGKIQPPYGGVERCMASHCGQLLSEDTEAYLFTQTSNRKLVVFCGDCAIHVELNCRQRFVLVAF